MKCTAYYIIYLVTLLVILASCGKQDAPPGEAAAPKDSTQANEVYYLQSAV